MRRSRLFSACDTRDLLLAFVLWCLGSGVSLVRSVLDFQAYLSIIRCSVVLFFYPVSPVTRQSRLDPIWFASLSMISESKVVSSFSLKYALTLSSLR